MCVCTCVREIAEVYMCVLVRECVRLCVKTRATRGRRRTDYENKIPHTPLANRRLLVPRLTVVPTTVVGFENKTTSVALFALLQHSCVRVRRLFGSDFAIRVPQWTSSSSSSSSDLSRATFIRGVATAGRFVRGR